MAKASLTADEVAMIMKMISIFMSFNKTISVDYYQYQRMAKGIDSNVLLKALDKLENPIEEETNGEKIH